MPLEAHGAHFKALFSLSKSAGAQHSLLYDGVFNFERGHE